MEEVFDAVDAMDAMDAAEATDVVDAVLTAEMSLRTDVLESVEDAVSLLELFCA